MANEFYMGVKWKQKIDHISMHQIFNNRIITNKTNSKIIE